MTDRPDDPGRSPEIFNLVIDGDAPVTIDWGTPTPVDERRYDQIRQDIASNTMADEFAEIAKDPEKLAEAAEYTHTMMAFNLRVTQAADKLPARLRAHYRRELTAILRDVARDLGLRFEDLDEMQRAHVCLSFIFGDDDDGGGDEAPAPSPDGGARKPVPA